jgi:hypothetical protein
MTRDDTRDSRPDDLEGIRQAALDYMQGWYEGDAERMRRCLHPELAKRGVWRDPTTGEQHFGQINKQRMVEKTQEGGGSTEVPAEKRFYDATILSVNGEIACARADTYEYVDYLQLARCDGTWQIVNVIWTFNQEAR